MNAPLKVSVALAVSCLALGAGGCARTGGNGAAGESVAAASIAATAPAVSFTQADLDGDARITRQEFDLWLRQTGRQEAFDAADANVNGVLTLDEWQAVMAAPNAAAGASRAPSPRPR